MFDSYCLEGLTQKKLFTEKHKDFTEITGKLKKDEVPGSNPVNLHYKDLK